MDKFRLNPRLKTMLGQKENRLDFRKIMDERKFLLLDLGRCDSVTNRLIGSLVVTGIELAIRRRKNKYLWNLTIDEFAGYVASEGSIKTLAHVFSEGREFRLSMTVAHQDLSQLTPRMIGALSNVQTKVIFGIGRKDAEFFAKLEGQVDPDVIKRDPKTDTQYELFSTIPEQWEKWIDRLRFQPARQATLAAKDGRVIDIRTITIPQYTATDDHIEQIRKVSMSNYGISYGDAIKNLYEQISNPGEYYARNFSIPEFEVMQ
ncbi:MAG: hypothetical protein WBD56_08105 [Anaerolineales bacterium]